MTEVLQLQPYIQNWRDRGIELLIVTSASAKDMTAFISKHDLTITVLLDSERQATRLYGVSGIPATFVIDRDGVPRQRKAGWGSRSLSELVDLLDSLDT